MNEAKHTPGPWYLEEVGYSSSSYYIRGSFDSGARHTIGKGAVAHIPRSTVNPMEANARLIAAAPELLEALKEVTEILDEVLGFGTEPSHGNIAAKARAAIAKATGRADSGQAAQGDRHE